MFRQNLRQAQWTAIETGATSQGVPDHEYVFPGGHQGWVEFKSTNAWAVRLRPEQIGWLLRRSRLGGRCFVAVVRQGHELSLIDGAKADVLGASGLKAVVPVLWLPELPWDWSQIQRVLTGV
jgi:hypothetical protein